VFLIIGAVFKSLAVEPLPIVRSNDLAAAFAFNEGAAFQGRELLLGGVVRKIQQSSALDTSRTITVTLEGSGEAVVEVPLQLEALTQLSNHRVEVKDGGKTVVLMRATRGGGKTPLSNWVQDRELFSVGALTRFVTTVKSVSAKSIIMALARLPELHEINNARDAQEREARKHAAANASPASPDALQLEIRALELEIAEKTKTLALKRQQLRSLQ
jgi:hypothetical protein